MPCLDRKDAGAWAKRYEKWGAGGTLPSIMDRDETQMKYGLKFTKTIFDAVHLPVVASGGAGKRGHYGERVVGRRAGALSYFCFPLPNFKFR